MGSVKKPHLCHFSRGSIIWCRRLRNLSIIFGIKISKELTVARFTHQPSGHWQALGTYLFGSPSQGFNDDLGHVRRTEAKATFRKDRSNFVESIFPLVWWKLANRRSKNY